MTETAESSSSNPAGKSWRKKLRLLAVVLVALCAVVFAAYRFCPWGAGMQQEGNGPTESPRLEQRLAAAERQIRTLNARIDDLTAQAGKSAGATENTSSSHETAVPSAALAHMQSDLVALSAAVNALQAEVRRAGAAAAETQKAAQASVAAAIAFIQLRAAAEAGRGFAPELANMRAAAPDDAGFREIAAKLDPYAAKGAPVVSALREDFILAETPVSVAMKKAGAQTWWQRLLAELGGLISIRPLHGGDGEDACAAAEEALSAGDVNAALRVTDTLPPEAQDVLKEWRAKAEARAAIDSNLRDLSERFATLTGSSPPSDTQEAP